MKLILALILLGLVGFGVYLGKNQVNLPQLVQSPTQTPDPTVNWKTYINYEGKYSLKYPNEYELMAGKSGGSVDGVISDSPNTTLIISPLIPATNGNFILSISYSPKSISLSKFAHENCSSTLLGREDSYSLGGNESLLFENAACGARGGPVIYSIKNGLGYKMQIEETVDTEKAKPYYEKILSTFRFIE